MINYIVGEIALKNENLIVIECNGIGYELFCSMQTVESVGLVGSTARVFTFMSVREDGISLFGFASIEEKEMFLKLISVSGIGPRVAIAVLSGLRLSDLAVAIKTEDIKLISTIKGLGRKTAERLILELKDKIDVVGFAPLNVNIVNSSAVDEATDALVALGVGKNEAYRLARENATENSTPEEIITKAFKNLNS